MREVLLPQEMVHTGDLILVNAQFPFRKTGTDRFLLPASFGGNRVLLDGRVARLLEKLVLDLGGGEALCPVSGWRSREEQEAIYTRSLQEHGRRFTEQYVALPGHSEHQTGFAVDLGLRSETIDFLRPDFPTRESARNFGNKQSFMGLSCGTPRGKRTSPALPTSPGISAMWGNHTGRSWRPNTWLWRNTTRFCGNFPQGSGITFIRARG